MRLTAGGIGIGLASAAEWANHDLPQLPRDVLLARWAGPTSPTFKRATWCIIPSGQPLRLQASARNCLLVRDRFDRRTATPRIQYAAVTDWFAHSPSPRCLPIFWRPPRRSLIPRQNPGSSRGLARRFASDRAAVNKAKMFHRIHLSFRFWIFSSDKGVRRRRTFGSPYSSTLPLDSDCGPLVRCVPRGTLDARHPNADDGILPARAGTHTGFNK